METRIFINLVQATLLAGETLSDTFMTIHAIESDFIIDVQLLSVWKVKTWLRMYVAKGKETNANRFTHSIVDPVGPELGPFSR